MPISTLICRPIAPVTYAGLQSGFGVMPDFHLWTLTDAISSHPAGTTLSEGTLAALGYDLPSLGRFRASLAVYRAVQPIRQVQVLRQAKKDSFNPWAE